ncbi:MAG TPA: hypothetical protein VLB44_26425 [Kofleriaceae bacterium]|nr:hypothetical protein [Kofleriaceae bacterium]
MASASGFVTGSGVGAAPSFRRALLALLAFALVACGDDQPRGSSRPATAAHGSNAADPAAGVTTDLDGPAPAFGDGVLAELTGDETAARASYERVLGSQDAPADVAARAALHLAQLEARAGKTGRARDLIARAAALAPADPTITEGADRVRAEIVARSSAGDIRGPKIGTQLAGVEPEVAALFAQAEQALARVHAMRPRQRLAVWEKEDATADVVRRYRAVAEHGGVAQIAAEYRIGTLFHDLALSLLFEPPADLRRTLRAGAFAYLKKATTAYKASLATAAPTENEQLWHLAAETDLRAALDVLGEASP